jgi:type I restriction enzyme, S subunit
MLLSNLNLLATAPGGVARLRELILTLAVQGKLVPQDAKDEPASALLKKIRAEKDRLIAEGKIKRDKPLAEIAEEEKPFGLPKGWEWSNLATVGVINPRNDASDETIASFVEMRSIPVAFSAEHVTESRPWRDIKSGFTQFAEGDVGVAKITPCFENGKSTVFQNLSNGIGAGTTELHIVRPLGGIAPKYVLLFLKTPAFLLNGEAVMTGSAGQKRMPRDYFERTPFPLPPLAEQSRIVTRVEELMRLCDALEAKGQLEATQHAQLVSTLLTTLTESETPAQLADNWHRIATHFDLLLDRPEAVDALEQTILQLAVRGLLVPQDPQDEPASELLKKIRTEKDKLIAEGKIKRDKPLPPIAEDEQPFALPQGWEWQRVSDVVEMLNGYAFKSEWFKQSGVRLLRNLNVSHGYVDWSQPAAIDAKAATEYQQFALQVGDIVLSLDRPIISTGLKYAVIRETDLPCLLLQRVARLAPDAKLVSADFLALWLQSDLFVGTIDPGRSNGIPHISTKQVGGLAFALPPLAEQSRIVTRVTELRRLCADLRQRLSASQSTQAHMAEALVQEVA